MRATTGGLLLYTPVVHPDEFDVAISYLVRRLEENACTENFMSGLFELDDTAIFQRERDRFAASLADSTSSCPRRAARRTACIPRLPHARRDFENAADTDPSLAVNREWGRGILARSAKSKLGVETIAAPSCRTRPRCARSSSRSAQAGAIWGKLPATERGELLDRIGEVLSVFRGRLIEVMASETGKTVAEADVEVSEAVDFAHYYAAKARELERIDGAVFVPAGVTVVVPPWNFPVAIPAAGCCRRSPRAAPCSSSPRRRPSAAVPCSPRRSGRPAYRAS